MKQRNVRISKRFDYVYIPNHVARRGLAYSKAAAPTNSAATKAVPERCSKRSMAPAVEGVAEAAELEPEPVAPPELPLEAEPDSELELEPEVLVAWEPEVEAAVTKPLPVAEALPEVPVVVLVLSEVLETSTLWPCSLQVLEKNFRAESDLPPHASSRLEMIFLESEPQMVLRSAGLSVLPITFRTQAGV